MADAAPSNVISIEQRADADLAVLKRADPGRQPPSNAFRLHHIAALLAQPTPVRWLVRQVLDVESVACLFGAPGSGKSFAAIDLGLSIATGTEWHGHAVGQGPVIYLAGEGVAGIRRRVLAWSIARGVDLKQAPFYLSEGPVSLADVLEADRVVKAARDAVGVPALVIVDTVHRHFGPADENSSADMGRFIESTDNMRRELGCGLLLVHHAGHAAADRERGSSALRAALDWSYSMQKGDVGPAVFQCRKSKDHEQPEPLHFALRSIELPWLDDLGHHETSAVLIRQDGPAEAALGANQLLAMDALRKLTGKARAAGIQAPTESEWRTATGLDRKRWAEVRKALVDRGAVIQTGDLVELPE